VTGAWPTWWLDVPLAALLVEVAALALLTLGGRLRWPLLDWLFSLLAGLALMLALRAAVLGQPLPLVLALLAAAGILHGLDLKRRFGGSSSRAGGR
jgi:hypothetical protein